MSHHSGCQCWECRDKAARDRRYSHQKKCRTCGTPMSQLFSDRFDQCGSCQRDDKNRQGP